MSQLDRDASRRNSALVGAGILLSRLSGLVRERAFAHFLGLSFAADAFVAAFRIPNLMQNLLGEGVLSASFIPVYARLLDEGRREEAGQVAGAVAGILATVVGILVVLGVTFAEPMVSLITLYSLPERTHDLAVVLMRIVTPGIGFLVLSAWALGVLNSHRRFFLSYVAPVLWNLAQVLALVVGGAVLLTDLGAPGAATPETLADLARVLAWGTVVGGVLQLGVQLPGVRRLARGLRVSLRAGLPGVRRTIRAFGPVVAGRGVVQLMTFVDLGLASLLAGSAISALGKGQMLYLLPISLFGMSVAAAELPELSTAGAQDGRPLVRRLEAGLERIAFYVVPTVVGFVALGDVLVGALFRTGKFDRPDVILVWVILIGFSIGLVATTSARLLQSAFYGAGDTATPAKLAAVRVGVAAALGGALMLQLDRIVILDGALALMDGADLPALAPLPPAERAAPGLNHLGAVGLAVASGVAGWVELWLLRRALRERVGRDVRPGGPRRRAILAAGAVAAVVAVGLRPVVTGLHPILGAAVAVPVTAAAYLAVAARLDVGEATRLTAELRRRLTR